MIKGKLKTRRYKRISAYRMRKWKLTAVNFLSRVVVIGPVLAFFLILFFFFWYSRQLPSPDRIVRHEGFSTVILDRNEKPIYDIYQEQNRIPVLLSDVPEFLINATIAIEDKDFYKHQGFDPKGMLRAFFKILTLQGLQGGSTLTQQLVKNVLLSSERTIPRKIKEFILAVQIENRYSKDEILQMYLNEAPYGGTMWGIEAAAQGYFGKKVSELEPIESVILAGFPQRPSFYSPFGPNKDAYKNRAKQVLRRMVEDGYITEFQENELILQLDSVEFKERAALFYAPHFVMYVRKLLIDQFGGEQVEKGGLRVVTTLDLELQKKVEEIVFEEIEKLKGLNIENGAALVIDPGTGEILSYVGSRDYSSEDEDFEGKFDVVSMGHRQPGSALKPITYAVAFNKGYTPSSIIMDVETHFPGGQGEKDYIPKNYDGKFRGPVQLRFALGNSINVPAVKLTALVGVSEVLKQAYNMGIESLRPSKENAERLGLSITLGGGEVTLLELVSAYSVFANEGILNHPVVLSQVIDKNGKVIFEAKQVNGKRVLSEEVAFLISHILLDNNARKDVFGENSYLVVPGKTVSVKTGTTDDIRDNWTVGYTPSIAAGVWVGNNDNTPMNPSFASGVTGAAPIWNRIMRELLKNKDSEMTKRPDKVIALTIDAFGGGLPHPDYPTRSEYFIKGTEPTDISPIYKKIKVSKQDSSKLASLSEILKGEYEEKEFIVFEVDDPISSDVNRWQEAINKWIGSNNDPKYHPPTEKSSGDDEKIALEIENPHDNDKFSKGSVDIKAKARAISTVEKLELYIDDKLENTSQDDKLEATVDLGHGQHTIKVKAYDSEGNQKEKQISIEIDISEGKTDSEPSPTSLPTAAPT